MLAILANRTYARLFSAQIVALLGTGLLTVALGLSAYEIAGGAAGAVLGMALTIKMVAYVGFSPIANALAGQLDRKRVLIAADLLRVVIALMLPFVDAIWQIYLLIFVLQAASATFTPTFQALIPDILPAEADYTKALSLSRLAYDLENVVSPVLAGLALSVISFHWLYAGTAIGFLFSSLLIMATQVPGLQITKRRGFADRLSRGARIYLATPRLRGLLALNLAAASVGAVVIVNTIVIVRVFYNGTESDVAVAFACFGLGSMLSALVLPSLLNALPDRRVMMIGAFMAATVLTVFGLRIQLAGWVSWPLLLGIWFLIGLFYASILTPSGRLLRRSAHAEDRAAIFAAQFALSHACWLVAYPLAGTLGNSVGMAAMMLGLAGLAALSLITGYFVWPHEDSRVIEHSHDDLPADHQHFKEAAPSSGTRRHRHVFVIDDEHTVWPTQG